MSVQTAEPNDPVKKEILFLFYVSWSRAHDPRNDTDDDEESKEEKEAVPLENKISLRFVSGIQDTDPDMIQTFTRLFRKAIPLEKYIVHYVP